MKIKSKQMLPPLLLSLGLFPLFSYAELKPQQIPLEDVQRFSAALSQIKNYYVKHGY